MQALHQATVLAVGDNPGVDCHKLVLRPDAVERLKNLGDLRTLD